MKPPPIVGAWLAYPWQDIPLFVSAYERGWSDAAGRYYASIAVHRPPPVLRARSLKDLPPIAEPALQIERLDRVEYRWGSAAAYVYCVPGDSRVLRALALLGLAARLLDWMRLRVPLRDADHRGRVW